MEKKFKKQMADAKQLGENTIDMIKNSYHKEI